jgi:tRNA threonylcarbamoyladenosine biosynthesis protein TsaE
LAHLQDFLMKQIAAYTYTLDNIADVAKQFWRVAAGYHLITFTGDMGAGKTTFIHKVCDFLQVQDVVSSPTFALVNEYHFLVNNQDQIIFHIDWYRLRDAEDAISAGMEDYVNQARQGRVYCFIEWPEKAAELLLRPRLHVDIQTLGPSERNMTLSVIE